MVLKVLIVDDHEAARAGIAGLLANSEAEIAGSTESAEQALALLEQSRFDVALIDVRMQSVDGLAALETIRGLYPDLPVIMLSTYDNPTYVARASALGASDYLLKSTSRDDLIATIRRATTGEPNPSDSALSRVQRMMRQDPAAASRVPADLPLTGREAQVLRHVALGLSNKEIARSLKISVETVKEHVQNVLRKLKANDRTDAAVRAVKMGIVE